MTTPHAILEIDLAAITANWRTLKARHPGGDVAGVIKADAYGLGAREVAAALYTAGCRHFFVAWLQEALAVRDLLPGAMIAVLGGLLPGTEADYVVHDLTPVLGSLDEIDRWRAVASAPTAGHAAATPPTLSASPHRSLNRHGPACPGHLLQHHAAIGGPDEPGHDVETGISRQPEPPKRTSLSAILHIDTGMSRLGLSASDMAVLAANPGRLGGVAIRYVMTHLVSAETPGEAINREQHDRFQAARAALPPAPISLANSSGIFLGPDFGSDLARPGAALYGINPTPGQPNPMQTVLLLKTRVLSVRDIPAGATVGYNATWKAAHQSRIATAALGYADGYHRSLSGHASAYFDGTPVPLVGRISMDLTTFDVTDHPAVQPGCWLEVLGPHLTPDDVAAAAGTNGYEVLTSLGRRFQRVYRSA